MLGCGYALCIVSCSVPAPLEPRDVAGCRYRTVLRRAGQRGDWEGRLAASVEGLALDIAHHRRLSQVASQLPTQHRLGDKVRFSRVDIAVDDPNPVESTLEALAAGVRVVTNAHLSNAQFAVRVDVLVRLDLGQGVDEFMEYAPVLVSAHGVVRRADRELVTVLDVSALGLGRPVPARWRKKSNPGDSQALAMAHIVLSEWGCAADVVGLVATSGDAAFRCFFTPAEAALRGLEAALSQPVITQPVRVRECESCEFRVPCRVQLMDRLDVSLLLPGTKGERLRDEGIVSLPQLASAGRGEQSVQAMAWLRGLEAVRRELGAWVQDQELWGGAFSLDLVDPEARADWVEIDVDMEAHPERGTFLWGTFDGSTYRAFEDFSTTGDEGRHVAEFWQWLQRRLAAAAASGVRAQVYVYAAQGENYWLRHYAARFGGRDYGEVRMPTMSEVNALLNSPQWCDVFQVVRKALVATGSLGLKHVAPMAGFRFSQQGMDGRAAVALFETALRPAAEEALSARQRLQRYNADDCYATRAVREWLRRGAPGLVGVKDLQA